MPSEHRIQPALQQFFLRILLGDVAAPSVLYIGLLTSLPSERDEISLERLSTWEPDGIAGYARQGVEKRLWSFMLDPIRAETEGVWFRNAAGVNWPQIRGAFLATSVDNSGILVGWNVLEDATGRAVGRLLLPGDTLNVPFVLGF